MNALEKIKELESRRDRLVLSLADCERAASELRKKIDTLTRAIMSEIRNAGRCGDEQ